MPRLRALGARMATLCLGRVAAAATTAESPSYLHLALVTEWRAAASCVVALHAGLSGQSHRSLHAWLAAARSDAVLEVPTWRVLRGGHVDVLEATLSALCSSCIAGERHTEQCVAHVAARDMSAFDRAAAAAWLQEMKSYYCAAMEFALLATALLRGYRLRSVSDFAQTAAAVLSVTCTLCTDVRAAMQARHAWMCSKLASAVLGAAPSNLLLYKCPAGLIQCLP